FRVRGILQYYSRGHSCSLIRDRTKVLTIHVFRPSLFLLRYVLASSSIIESSRLRRAAAVFSSRCFNLEVPGIGRVTGDFFSNQARATWEGVAPSSFAIFANGPWGFARSPVASGNQGINPML